MKLRRRRPTGAAPIETHLPYKLIRENLILSSDGLWVVYTLGQQPYPLTTVQDQLGVVLSAKQRWSELAGHRVQLRVTAHPFPHQAWARALHQSVGGRRLPDVEGGETWGEYLAASQDAAIRARCETPQVFLLVRVTTRRLDTAGVAKVLGTDPVASDTQKIRDTLRRINDTVAMPGFDGKATSTRAIAWLIHASAALGVPAPDVAIGDGDIGREDLDVFTGAVDVESDPYDPHVTVHAIRSGERVTRYATVLSMGASERRPEAGKVPWLAWPRGLDYPVEIVGTFDVIAGDELTVPAQQRRDLLEDNIEHYEEHKSSAPKELLDARGDAQQILDEVSSGSPEDACRLLGVIRASLAADSPELLSRMIQDFKSRYWREQRIQWDQSFGQQKLVTEFLPAHPITLPGFRRQIGASFMATAVPNSASSIGTPYGPLAGYVCMGGSEAFLFDPVYGSRVNESGLTGVPGTSGRGKTVFLGTTAEHQVRIGRQVYINDPSNHLQRLADAPHLRRATRVINLQRATPGTLNPYPLVPEPRIEDFPRAAEAVALEDRLDDDATVPDRDEMLAVRAEYRAAVAAAQAERVQAAINVVTGLLPAAMVSGPTGGSYQAAIREAAAEAPADPGATLWDVLDRLESGSFGDFGRSAARQVRSVAHLPGATLLFPEPSRAGDILPNDAPLTIITYPGLEAPMAGTPREFWEVHQQIAALVMSNATRFVARAMYQRGPKVIITDEGAIATEGLGAVLASMLRWSRDTRKHEAAFMLASQNPGDFLPISEEIANLMGAMVIFGMRSRESAAAALKLGGIPTGIGIEQLVLGLNNGQALVRDWTHLSPQVVQILARHRPVMERVLFTTARPDAGPVFDHTEVLTA